VFGVGDIAVDVSTGPIRFRRDFGRFPVALSFAPENPVLDSADILRDRVVGYVYDGHGFTVMFEDVVAA
jgi:hypothetical protein